MNGQKLAKLGQEARKNSALDRPTKFNGVLSTWRKQIDSWKFINGEAKFVTKNMQYKDVIPHVEYRLKVKSCEYDSYIVGPKAAFDYLGSKLIKEYIPVNADFTGKLI